MNAPQRKKKQIRTVTDKNDEEYINYIVKLRLVYSILYVIQVTVIL